MTQYSMTLMNSREDASEYKTFGAFTHLATESDGANSDPFQVAWFSHNLYGGGDAITFYWQLLWDFQWAATGFDKGKKWDARGHRPADPELDAQCQTIFDYDKNIQQWHFRDSDQHAHDNYTLWVDDSPNIPDKPGSSVGVAMYTSAMANSNDTWKYAPVIAIGAEMNMHQSFDLHPTYYVMAGNWTAGDMVDVASVTNQQEVQYEGVHDMTAELLQDNTWKVYPSQDRLVTPRPSADQPATVRR